MDRDLTVSRRYQKPHRPVLPFCQWTLKTLASALVLSRIDYGNKALVNLPKVATQSIQSIINTTARLITGVRKYGHITPVLKELHWLKNDES